MSWIFIYLDILTKTQITIRKEKYKHIYSMKPCAE